MKELISYLTCLDDQQSTMLDLVLDLANTNSGTFHLEGLARVKQRLIRELNALGGEIHVIDSKPLEKIDEQGNLSRHELGQMIHVTKHADAPFKVALCIHMDTVYPVDHPFQECRTLEDGRINGPGVADAKGGAVVMLFALKALEASPLAGKIGWEILYNADEEIGSQGSVELIHEISKRCDVGLLFEPSLPDGTLVSWRKGSGNFTFVVRGQAAHAGREFEKGRNAVVAAARLMDEVDQLNVDAKVTFNVGKIDGGGPLNVVPDLAMAGVNIRVVTVEQQQVAESQLQSLVEKYNSIDGISVEMYGKFSSPPKPLCEKAVQLQNRIASCGEALGIKVGWRGTGGACDGNKFAAAGLPNIDTLGPRGGNIHSDAEYLLPESLVPCAKLAGLTLLTLANEQ